MYRLPRLIIVLFILCSCLSPTTPTAFPQPTKTRVLPVSTITPEPTRSKEPRSTTDTPETSTTRVLFLGNSYTYGNNLPELFAELARSGGHQVEVGMVAEGGWRLSDHAQSTETLGQLASNPWTFVVLQEQSQIPALKVYRTREMYPAARELVSKIRENGATPIFFLTWAHRDGWPIQGMKDYGSMQIKINEGYMEIAEELDVTIAPVGSAWLTAVQQYPGLNLWRDDGSHPRKQGSYLAACVIYATIFQESPVGLDYSDLPSEKAQTLQSIASKVVLNVP